MPEIFLLFHSYFRWIVIFTFIISIFFLINSYKSKIFLDTFKKIHKIFAIALSIQFLIGLILYGLSPITMRIFTEYSVVMKDKDLRFFAVEHNFILTIALALSHITNAKLKKETQDFQKEFRIVLIFYILIIILLTIGIPWYRPLLRY